jgi:hypothetical protein
MSIDSLALTGASDFSSLELSPPGGTSVKNVFGCFKPSTFKRKQISGRVPKAYPRRWVNVDIRRQLFTFFALKCRCNSKSGSY